MARVKPSELSMGSTSGSIASVPPPGSPAGSAGGQGMSRQFAQRDRLMPGFLDRIGDIPNHGVGVGRWIDSEDSYVGELNLGEEFPFQASVDGDSSHQQQDDQHDRYGAAP